MQLQYVSRYYTPFEFLTRAILQVYSHPWHTWEYDAARLRMTCDAMIVFFFFDDASDVVSAPEVQAMANIMMDALRNPHKPRSQDEWVGGEVIRQYVLVLDSTSIQ